MKNVFKFLSLSALFVCLSLFTGSVFAQTSTTGSIEGTVTDTTGATVPGVSIRVTSPNLISAQSATSDDNGRYKIQNLPPGRYNVVVEAVKGFAKFEKTEVEVNLSRSSSVEIQLQPAGAVASVTVTDTTGAAVDITANTTGSNVSTEQFSNFPTQRTVQSLYSIAPTVARSGLRDASGRDRDPSVAGSSGPENNYILDGVNTTDPAFGGSGANLPFEFVQEVEVKTGAYGAEYGRSTGGIFNVITKSGGNEIHGDGFGYFTTQGLVRETKQFPFQGSAPNGFSEFDGGIDVGGPIAKDKLWFFGAFNPQQRKNYFLTQQFHNEVNNKITTPFYSGKVTWAVNTNNTATFSTFGDFTKQEGFLFGGSGFGADPNSFQGEIQTGGHNYIARLNSTFNSNMTGEFAFGLHYQRANTIPLQDQLSKPLITDNFAIVGANGSVLTPVNTTAQIPNSNFVAFVDGRGGSLQRNFIRQGFGLFSNQDRNRVEFSARMQNIWKQHTVKYGFEYGRNIYKINTISTGTPTVFPDPLDNTEGSGNNDMIGFRTTNNFGVCTVQGTNVACPAGGLTTRVQALITAGLAPAGITSTSTVSGLSAAQLSTNPFLVLSSVRVRDFRLIAPSTNTNMEAFYVQDDWKVTRNFQVNVGLRWDYQQAYGSDSFSYLKLNNFMDNAAPRLGFIWDFTGKGRGKIFLNWAKYVETPLPLDLNVRAGSDTTQTDKNINVSTLNSPATAFVVADIGNLGSTHTPIDPELKPQDVKEWTGGIQYEIKSGLTLGFRGIYRYQGQVIEDGSFDDGDTYFLFNPGRRGHGGSSVTTEDLACEDPGIGCFGHARRYYRALEFTATKRFANNYQFIASYVYSSLIGNYEGLFRNDNGQSDPNITSLFDLVSLLKGMYGRLPNDRPHQLKFDGSYRTPWKLNIGGSFRAQSGIPFNALVPHPVYGNNEGFCVGGLLNICHPRGTAIVPTVTATQPGFPNVVDSIGDNRTPTTFNLDLNAYYPISFGEKRELRFQADWFNVFNSQRAVRLDETLLINSGIPGLSGSTLTFNNPFYGAGTIFQFPSSLRLGVKFTF
ncbi:MAG TPA: TonB-dependent receptor [Pyrinomonadaceae bacterium]|nr:TonB-dependent receptor [Pyrinomonadaceae bacterium]